MLATLRRRDAVSHRCCAASTLTQARPTDIAVAGMSAHIFLYRLTAQLIFTAYLHICHSFHHDQFVRPTPSARAGALAEELRSLVGKLKRRLREQAGPEDLTPSQVSILLRLEKDGPATVSSLARSEKMRPQSMSTAVAALLAAGLVSGAPDPEDGRQTILSLTKACRDWIRVGRAARQDWLSRTISARLSPREQDELAAAVSLLKRLVDD